MSTRISKGKGKARGAEQRETAAEIHSADGKIKPGQFSLLLDLPVELQCYMLHFLPARTLVKTFGRMNKYCLHLVDSHVRCKLLSFVAQSIQVPTPGDGSARHSSDRKDEADPLGLPKAPPSVLSDALLVFEAQRPIDTMTAKHTLHFSHFSVSTSAPFDAAYTTFAHFGFAAKPAAPSKVRSRSSTTSSTSDLTSSIASLAASRAGQSAKSGLSASTHSLEQPSSELQLGPAAGRFGPHGAASQLGATLGQPHLPSVAERDAVNMGWRESTSSVLSYTPIASPVAERASFIDTPSSEVTTMASTEHRMKDVARPLSFRDDDRGNSASSAPRTSIGSSTEESEEEDGDDDAFDEEVGSGGMNSLSGSGILPETLAAASAVGTSTPQPSMGEQPLAFPFLAFTQQLRHMPSPATASPQRPRSPSNPRWVPPPRLRPAIDVSLGMGLERALDAYDWAPPTSLEPDESPSRYRSESQLRTRPAKPTYRFMLDPLDSFETWILTLSLRRRSEMEEAQAAAAEARRIPTAPFGMGPAVVGGNEPPPPGPGPAVRLGPGRQWARPLRWEKRIAEGLDRVFRDWFDPPAGSTEDANLSSHRSILSTDLQLKDTQAALDALVSSMQNRNVRGRPVERLAGSAANTPRMGGSRPDSASGSLSRSGARTPKKPAAGSGSTILPGVLDPPLRTIEFDSPSCTLSIQPHPSVNATTGANLAMSSASHAYLSHPSLSAQYNSLESRIQLTFHCEEVRINAARLLALLEAVEANEIYMHQAARRKALAALVQQQQQWRNPAPSATGSIGGAPSPQILSAEGSASGFGSSSVPSYRLPNFTGGLLASGSPWAFMPTGGYAGSNSMQYYLPPTSSSGPDNTEILILPQPQLSSYR